MRRRDRYLSGGLTVVGFSMALVAGAVVARAGVPDVETVRDSENRVIREVVHNPDGTRQETMFRYSRGTSSLRR
jgi:hypothetical protein